MTKQKMTERHVPEQLLQQGADKLAAAHQQRLHQMTRAAVYGAKPDRALSASGPSWFRENAWTVVAPVFSLSLLVLVWQLVQQADVAIPSPPLALKEPVPDWVKDAEVPVAVIENIEFYQWLEKELQNETENEAHS